MNFLVENSGKCFNQDTPAIHKDRRPRFLEWYRIQICATKISIWIFENLALVETFFQRPFIFTIQLNSCLDNHYVSHLKGFLKKVTPLLFNFIPFLPITIILLYDQKMFSCLRISYQSTSWY